MEEAVALTVLTEEDLAKISGAATRKTMIEWLAQKGIPYLVARSGWPRVDETAMKVALGTADKTAGATGPSEISFDGLR